MCIFISFDRLLSSRPPLPVPQFLKITSLCHPDTHTHNTQPHYTYITFTKMMKCSVIYFYLLTTVICISLSLYLFYLLNSLNWCKSFFVFKENPQIYTILLFQKTRYSTHTSNCSIISFDINKKQTLY